MNCIQIILTTLLSCTVSTVFITIRDKLHRHREQKMSETRDKRVPGRKK